MLQEPGWSDQDCYGLGYVDGPLAGRRRGLGRSPFTITNEDDIEFAIEDDEELYEAALAASHRPGGDPLAGLLRDM